MRHYEVTFIVDPVLSGDEIKATAQKYVNQLQENGCDITYVDEMGLRQLAFEINKRNSGYYYVVEFQTTNGKILDPLELNMRRDEKLLRYLSVKLDKFGVKYNEDKRKGLIGKVKKKPKPQPTEVAPPKPKPPKVVPPQPDNLKRIEGIGPKIAEALKAAGINSFAKLASMTPEDVKTTLLTQGDRFSFQDTTTWSAQADLAAKGEWDKLKKWQEELKAGKLGTTEANEAAVEKAEADVEKATIAKAAIAKSEEE